MAHNSVQVSVCWKLCVCVIIFLMENEVYAGDKFDMSDYCGRELSFITNSIYQMKLEFDDDYQYRGSNRPCDMKIEAWYTTYPKLMLYFEDLDLDCDQGYLEFYHYDEGQTRISGLETVCGHKPSGVFTSLDRYIRIKYVPRNNQKIDDVFTIIVTAFNDDSCPSYAHECKNGRCIDDDLPCNGYDSCGDGSGCDLSSGAIIGIVIGSLVGLALIVSIVVCCICCRRKSGLKPGTVQGTAQSQVAYVSPGQQGYTHGQQGYTQATYGTNQASPYPANLQTTPILNNMQNYPTAPQYQQQPIMPTNQPPYSQPQYYPTNQQPALVNQQQTGTNLGNPPAYEDINKTPQQGAGEYVAPSTGGTDGHEYAKLEL